MRRDNCLTQVEISPAQALLDEQSRVDWPRSLSRLTGPVHRTHDRLFAVLPGAVLLVGGAEEASDVLFRSAADLARWYPLWVRHGLLRLGSADVMRFLGRHTLVTPGYDGWFAGEVVTDVKERVEGVCVKHRVNGNSVKMYDKQGSVLRVETTINNARDLKVYRPKEGDEAGAKDWRCAQRCGRPASPG